MLNTHTNPLSSRRLLRPLGSALLCISLTACASDEVKQYRVAKVSNTQAASAAKPAAGPSAPFEYTIPSGWSEQDSSGMRSASFRTAAGGDVSVVMLPGMAGDLKGNVNRWRGQVALPPLEDLQEIQNSVSRTTIDGRSAVALELYAPADKPDKAMRVALLERDGINWFFKLSGTRELVKAEKAAFEQFTASITFKAATMAGDTLAQAAPPLSTDSSGPPGAVPPGMPPADANHAGAVPPAGDGSMTGAGMPSIAPVQTDTQLKYTLPANWTEKPPGSIRIASFEVKAAGLVGDVSVVNLAGDGGGLLSNTNRWRQQLEMAPTDQEGLKNSVKDIVVDGNKGYFMALYTGMEGQGMLVALIEQGEQTWFVKMLAPSKLIQSQEKAFESFVTSIQFLEKGARS
ncbi:MAG: hypothetical protein ACO1RX_21950 [Candidatus Sericytochromatia bacterium]